MIINFSIFVWAIKMSQYTNWPLIVLFMKILKGETKIISAWSKHQSLKKRRSMRWQRLYVSMILMHCNSYKGKQHTASAAIALCLLFYLNIRTENIIRKQITYTFKMKIFLWSREPWTACVCVLLLTSFVHIR